MAQQLANYEEKALTLADDLSEEHVNITLGNLALYEDSARALSRQLCASEIAARVLHSQIGEVDLAGKRLEFYEDITHQSEKLLSDIQLAKLNHEI